MTTHKTAHPRVAPASGCAGLRLLRDWDVSVQRFPLSFAVGFWLLGACSSSSPTSGGSAGTGGNARGGETGSGGAVSSGGQTSSGGAAGTGGVPIGSGGTSATDGGAGHGGSGGTTASGGSGGGAGISGGHGGSGGTTASGGSGGSAGTSDATVAPSSLAILSGVPWYSATGDVMNAHGAGLFQVNATFYLVGELRTTMSYAVSGDFETKFAGVSCYQSTNLQNWTYDGVALAVTPGTPLDGSNPAERPKVLFNDGTQKYVMFLHEWQNQSVAVAESASPCAGYQYVGDLTLNGSRISSGDIGVFTDDDGSAYLLDTNGSYYRLAADFHTATSSGNTGVLSATEAPAVIKTGGVYFFLASHMSWWHPNDNVYATATSMAGPWTSRGTLAPAGTDTFNSQTTFVFAVKGSQTTTILYAGDRWCDTCLPSTTNVWQPLQASGSALTLSTFHPAWSLNIGTGSWIDVSDTGAATNDATTGTLAGQIKYDASWTHKTCAAGDACFDGDETSTSSANATATFSFSGTQARLYAVVDVNEGLLGISVCDGQGADCGDEVPITEYAPKRAGNQLVWTSPVLPSATHTVKLRNLGTKDNYSSSTATTVDRLTVSDGSADL